MLILDDAKHWHERAMAARAMADQIDDPVAKEAMLKIAKAYSRIAERAEERAKHPPQSE